MADSTKVAWLPTSIASGELEVEARTLCVVSLAIKLERCQTGPEATRAVAHFMDNFVVSLMHIFAMDAIEGRMLR